MTREPSDLMRQLTEVSPRSKFGRFAQCFRNMGVVDHFERGRAEDTLIVRSGEQGIDFTPVREKGHEFHVVETFIDLSGGDPQIRHVLQLED